MSYYRMRPPRNRQNLDNSCWAAAIASFSRVTAGVPVQRERELIDRFGVGSTGGLNGTQLGALRLYLALFGVRIDLEAMLVMPYGVEDKLHDSHVVLARQLSGSAWHAWLVYGIDNSVLYMDPRDGGYHAMNWSGGSFSSSRGYYLFWKPSSSGSGS